MSDYTDELMYVRNKISEQREEIKDFMSGGNAKDYVEYIRLVGIIRGLDRVEDIIKDLQKRMENDDE